MFSLKKLIGLEKEKKFRVAIFGSARVKNNDVTYKRVRYLANMLGKNNIDIVTGGGPGLMRAASEGHKIGSKNTGALSIGIGIKLPWEQKFSKTIEYKKQFNIFSQRLDEFMLLSNAVVVAPGGLGTLLELFYTWQLVQVHHICHIPIILMGDTWSGLLKWIRKEPLRRKYLDKMDFNLVFHVKTPKQAMKIIEESHEHFVKGGRSFCYNYNKYKLK
ncbi:MAG: LOG family protein [Nanoarchaeota archaeon]